MAGDKTITPVYHARYESLLFQGANEKREAYKHVYMGKPSAGNWLNTKKYALLTGVTNLLSLFLTSVAYLFTVGQNNTVKRNLKGSAYQFGAAMQDLFYLKNREPKAALA